EPNLVESLEFVVQLGQVLEEGEGFLHRHVQHLIDVFTLVAHLQCLPVVPLAFTYLAGHIDIGEKVHLDFDKTISLAGLTTAASDVERETAWAITSGLGIRGGGKQVPDVIEEPSVSGRVGPGGTA